MKSTKVEIGYMDQTKSGFSEVFIYKSRNWIYGLDTPLQRRQYGSTKVEIGYMDQTLTKPHRVPESTKVEIGYMDQTCVRKGGSCFNLQKQKLDIWIRLYNNIDISKIYKSRNWIYGLDANKRFSARWLSTKVEIGYMDQTLIYYSHLSYLQKQKLDIWIRHQTNIKL